ncbi:mannitol 1-phosphate dehydrogenase 2 [Xylariomycetidae sp. FL0641]|nr:mannitol 1-phosphate dehydrogenase 2 [Xylariomycetidae sp. FL0641]
MPDDEQPRPFDLAIVGGGITGLTLAIALQRRGLRATIYEAAGRFGEIGAGVGFGPNAARALSLIGPGPAAAYAACRTASPGEETWFRVRVGDQRHPGRCRRDGSSNDDDADEDDALFDLRFPPGRATGGVHRAHFLDELVKLLEPGVTTCRFGKRLVDVVVVVAAEPDGDDDGDGKKQGPVVELRFADGTAARHTAVLGCDGIKARTRALVLGGEGAAPPVFTGKYVYRGLVPMARAVAAVGAARARHSTLYLGYHGHIITFPIAHGTIMNVVAFRSRDAWTSPDWVVRATKEEMLADYEAWGPMATALVSAMEKPDIWALFNHEPAPTYYSTNPRICLVGDAAHASTPHQGAGAGMGIEDCYILSNLIAEAKDLAGLDKAFKAYDEIRRPRTQKLVETSREASTLYDFELKGDDLDAIEQDMKQRMGWIWDIDLPAELEKAKSIFRS